MAGEELSGAKTEVTVDNEKTAESKEKLKKLIIKVAVIAVIVLVAWWAYKKFVR